MLQDLIKAIAEHVSPIRGNLALRVARLVHHYRLDNPSQWGNAYFRCPKCGQASDCTGHETPGDIECDHCGEALGTEHMTISEGWVEGL